MYPIRGAVRKRTFRTKKLTDLGALTPPPPASRVDGGYCRRAPSRSGSSEASGQLLAKLSFHFRRRGTGESAGSSARFIRRIWGKGRILDAGPKRAGAILSGAADGRVLVRTVDDARREGRIRRVGDAGFTTPTTRCAPADTITGEG